MIRSIPFALVLLLCAAPAWGQILPTYGRDGVGRDYSYNASLFFGSLSNGDLYETPEPSAFDIQWNIKEAKAAYPETYYKWYVSEWENAHGQISKLIDKFEVAEERRSEAGGGTYSLSQIAEIQRQYTVRQNYKMRLDAIRWALLRNDPIYLPAMDYDQFVPGRVGRVKESFVFDQSTAPQEFITHIEKDGFAGPPIVVSGLAPRDAQPGHAIRLQGVFRVEGTTWNNQRAFKLVHIAEGDDVFAHVAAAAKTTVPAADTNPAREAKAMAFYRAAVWHDKHGRSQKRDENLAKILAEYANTAATEKATALRDKLKSHVTAEVQTSP